MRASLLIIVLVVAGVLGQDPANELLSGSSQTLLKLIMEGISPPTLTKIPDYVVEGIPSDAIRDLKIDSYVLSNRPLTENFFQRKHVQNSRDVAFLLKDMSRAEMNTIKWKNVMPAMDPTFFESLDIKTANRLPWDKMFPYMNKNHAKYVTVPLVKQIPPVYWRTATPELMGGLSAEVFGEIPIDSLNEVPAESFVYVSTASWKQLGPRRFSQLNNGILAQVSQPTYEQLGRAFLSRVEQDKLVFIQQNLSTLSTDLPPRFYEIPDKSPSSEWDEFEKLDASTQAITELTRLMRGDEQTWDPPKDYPLVGDYLITLPGESAHKFSKQARESLRRTYWIERNQRFQSTARLILQEASVTDLQRMDWNELAKYLDAQTYNSFKEETILLLPWADILSNMPPEEIQGLTPRTISLIPPQHFSVLSAEQFSSFSPAVYKVLSVEQLRQVKPEAYSLLGGNQLKYIGAEKVNQLYEPHWQAISWHTVYAEMDDYKFFDELKPEVFKTMDFHRIFGEMPDEKVAWLSVKNLKHIEKEHFRSDNFAQKVQFINPEFFKEISEEQFRYMLPHAFKHMTTEQFENLRVELIEIMSEEQRKNVDWGKIMREADFNSMDPEFIRVLPADLFKFVRTMVVTAQEMSLWQPHVFDALNPGQIKSINWGQVMPGLPASTINNFSYSMWQSIPPDAMSKMTQGQFSQLTVDSFDSMTVRHLHSVPSEYFTYVTAEQVKAIGTSKLKEIGREHTDLISIEELYLAGDNYARVIGREKELELYIDTIEFRQMKRLLDSINQVSGEDPQNLLMSYDEREWDMISWQRVGRSIKCYQINTFDTPLMQKLPWQKLMVEVPPSTVECISSSAWDKIPATAVKFMTVEQFSAMNPATVAKFNAERLNSMPDEFWQYIDGYTLVRWSDAQWQEMPVEKMKLIKAESFTVVRASQWETFGEEKFLMLTPEIHGAVPEEVRAQVPFMANIEFPAEPKDESEYISFTEEEWYALQGADVAAIPISVLNFLPEDLSKMDAGSFTVEQLNAIPPFKIGTLQAYSWEAIGEEKFVLVDDAHKAFIPIEVREVVVFMSKYDLPPPTEPLTSNIGNVFGNLGDFGAGDYGDWDTGNGGLPGLGDFDYGAGGGAGAGGAGAGGPGAGGPGAVGNGGAPGPSALPGGGTEFKATCLSRTGCRVVYPS